MRVSNNIKAILILFFMILSLTMNLTLINHANTGLSGNTIAVIDLCINQPPIPIFDDCGTNVTALLPFTCLVNTTDYAENQAKLYTDNTSLFNINPSTGNISFTPSLMDIGNHSVLITVNDGSGCSNSIQEGVWNFTIIGLDENATVSLRSDTDNNTKYKYDPVKFYANFTSVIDNSTIIGASCVIEFNTTGSYTSPVSMVYNSSSLLYTYNYALGFLQGNHTYRVTCNGLDVGYSIDQDEEFFTITNRPPYVYAQFPNITIRQGTSLFGYNLNDYFKDEDLDILNFTSFTIPNVDIEISSAGDITFRPDAWFYGTRNTFFTATDGFDSVQGNIFTITVEQVVVTPDSGGGGGGGGGSSGPPPIACIEDWDCGNWSECTPQGFQYRQCVDNNTCYTTRFMPEISQECEYIGTCSDGIRNCHGGVCETGVDCGGLCEACVTCFDGIQNQGETGVDCGGPCDECRTEPRVEEPSTGIIITPEARRTGLSILLILAIIGALSVIVSFILHRQVMGRLAQLPDPQFIGSIGHVSAESRAVISVELARSDNKLSYKEKIGKLSSAFQKLIKLHLGEKGELTLEQIRNRSNDIGDERLASKILSLSQTIEEVEFKESKEEKDVESIIDPMLSIVHNLIHTKVHENQVAQASKTTSRIKHSFIRALLDIADSLIRNKRVYSAAMLVRESLIYYKQIKPSKILKEQMEYTVKELNEAVQRAREENNG